MKITKLSFLITGLLILVFIGDLRAGDRRGFYVRFDMGGGLVSTKAENPAWHNPEYTLAKGGGASVFALGYAPNDCLVLCASYRAIYYGEHASLALLMGPVGILIEDGNMLTSIGAICYFRPGIPSWFVEAAVGGGVIGNPFGDRLLSNEDQNGMCLLAGIGYQFLRNYQFELQFLWMRSDTGLQSREGRWTSLGGMATVGFTLSL